MTFDTDICRAKESHNAPNNERIGAPASGVPGTASDQEHPLAWDKTQEDVCRSTSESDYSQSYSEEATPANITAGSSNQRHSGSVGFGHADIVASQDYVQLPSSHSNAASSLSTVEAPLSGSLPKDSSGRSYRVRQPDLSDASHRTVSIQDHGSTFSDINAAELDSQGLQAPASGPSADFNGVGVDEEHSGFTAAELEALDYLTSQPAHVGPFSSATNQGHPLSWVSPDGHDCMLPHLGQVIIDSPNVYSMYYPNAAYQELHKTLHHHILEIAKITGSTRHGTPEPLLRATLSTRSDDRVNPNPRRVLGPLQSSALANGSPSSIKMTVRRELELWKNYLDEIAVWVRIFTSPSNERICRLLHAIDFVT